MQITNTLLMVRPAAFGANEETAATNFFQSTDTKTDPRSIQQAALNEFDNMVELLRQQTENIRSLNGVQLVMELTNEKIKNKEHLVF